MYHFRLFGSSRNNKLDNTGLCVGTVEILILERHGIQDNRQAGRREEGKG